MGMQGDDAFKFFIEKLVFNQLFYLLIHLLPMEMRRNPLSFVVVDNDD